MRTDTIFDMASVSKLFTSIVVLQLVEKGKVDLDAPIATYVPGVRGERQGNAFTVRQALTHTSGLPPGSRCGAPSRIPRPTARWR